MDEARKYLPVDGDRLGAAALTAAGWAIAGAARTGRTIWIGCGDATRNLVEVFVHRLGDVPAIILPSADSMTLKRLGRDGDLLLLGPGLSAAPLAATAQALGMRLISFTGEGETHFFTDFDLPLPARAPAHALTALAEIAVQNFAGRQTQKIFRDWSALRAAVSGLRPLVFTNGVFDILHRGHVHSLQEARAQGAYLMVGINSDRSVKRLGKGDDRPIQPEGDRAAILAALACVDFVTIFEEDTPERLIKTMAPDVLVKGGDYSIAQIAGADFVLNRGGRVVRIEFEHDRSTTKILSKIRSHAGK